MIDQDKLLNILTRHTNLMLPYSKYVSIDKFPEQNTSLLNNEVSIRYRNHYKYDMELLNVPATIKKHDGTIISSRPSDDDPLIPRGVGPESFDEDDIYTEKFRILRADNAEPYLLIGINSDYSVIVVNSSRPIVNTNSYEYENLISEYATQLNEFLNVKVKSQYFGEINTLYNGLVFRVDGSEPCYSIIMEYLSDTLVRFTLGDEHLSIIQEDNSDSIPITDYTIATFRKEALEGKTIYGTV